MLSLRLSLLQPTLLHTLRRFEFSLTFSIWIWEPCIVQKRRLVFRKTNSSEERIENWSIVDDWKDIFTFISYSLAWRRILCLSVIYAYLFLLAFYGYNSKLKLMLVFFQPIGHFVLLPIVSLSYFHSFRSPRKSTDYTLVLRLIMRNVQHLLSIIDFLLNAEKIGKFSFQESGENNVRWKKSKSQLSLIFQVCSQYG